MASNKSVTKRHSTRKSNTKIPSYAYEKDSTFFLKLVIFLVLGAQWVYIMGSSWQLPLPVGLIIGLVFATHEHFQIDRKIEYAVLLASTLIGFWLPLGLEIQIN